MRRFPSPLFLLFFYDAMQELEFELPADDLSSQGNGEVEPESPSDDDEPSVPVLRVNLSNGGELALRGRDVKVKRR